MLTNELLELGMWTQVQVSVLNALNSFLKYCELAITDFDALWVLEGYVRQFSIRTRSLGASFLNPTLILHNFKL
jgi:hypothetical protein